MAEMTPLLVRLPADLYDELAAEAERTGESMALVVRQALRRYLEGDQ